MVHSISLRIIGAIAAMACTVASWAAHPLQTEDTGTQGAGHIEFENGLSRSRDGHSNAFTYQPQVSYGLTPALDLIVQPSWLRQRADGQAAMQGLGDTNLDAKWRFYSDAPLSLALRAGVTVATAQKELGLPHGQVALHAVVAATYDAAPFVLHGNLGLTRNAGGPGERRHVGRVSGALLWAASERLTVALDAGAEADADPNHSAWPVTLLVGAIFTIRPGLDVDLGYQSSLRAPVATRQWLAGITYRFAP